MQIPHCKRRRSFFSFSQLAIFFAALLGAISTARSAPDYRFDFGSDATRPGFQKITSQTTYDSKQGYGFLSSGNEGSSNAPAGTNVSGNSNAVSFFAVDVPEGNYDVTLSFGGGTNATSTTVKAESRRLMLERVQTPPGVTSTQSFSVNVRRPAISTGGEVKLNGREKGPPMVPDWDDHLTFEFNGTNPSVTSMVIAPASSAITVYLAGDSTVTDQAKEPWSSWGQMLPRFFGPGVAVADHAESGEALFTFQSQRRLDKIISTMKRGDYLFIQFGHNDQKDKSPGAGPFTTYTENLKRFIAAAREKGGIPVLVTPMERRRWVGDQFQPTLADYAEAVRRVGISEKVPVIDLNAMSIRFYMALGPENSTKAFVHYPENTFPGQDKPLKDDTHHNVYGGYELARCVVEGIRADLPDLAKHLRGDTGSFSPSSPDDPSKFNIPPSPFTVTEKPAGN